MYREINMDDEYTVIPTDYLEKFIKGCCMDENTLSILTGAILNGSDSIKIRKNILLAMELKYKNQFGSLPHYVKKTNKHIAKQHKTTQQPTLSYAQTNTAQKSAPDISDKEAIIGCVSMIIALVISIIIGVVSHSAVTAIIVASISLIMIILIAVVTKKS